MKRLSILGSTGSIGRQALEVVDALPGAFEVVGLGARRDAAGLAEQARHYRPRAVALVEEAAAAELRDALPPGVEVFTGPDALRSAAAIDGDIVLVAVVGIAGLLPTLDALRSVFPAGTLTGAPKVRAMQLIAELEGERRGLYGGACGYLGYDGNLDTAIAIRSAVLRAGVAHMHTGAGIVAGSVPEREFQETEHKAAAMRRAIELAAEAVGATAPAEPVLPVGPEGGP